MKEAFLYENSGWFAAFVGGSHEWLKDKGQGGRYLDARTLCFYMGTVNTPAMVNKTWKPGEIELAQIIRSSTDLKHREQIENEYENDIELYNPCLYTGISISALAAAHAAEALKVTASNYVRAESDIQMTGVDVSGTESG